MKKRIVIAILCAAISAGTVGCGKDTASTGTTQTEETKKDSTENKTAKTTQSDEEKQSRDIFAMDTYMTVTAYGEHASDAVDQAETAYLFERSEKLYKQTKGVFDISIYPVMDTWGFPTENYKVPSEDELHTLLENVDASKIQYDKRTKKITLPEAQDLHLLQRAAKQPRQAIHQACSHG